MQQLPQALAPLAAYKQFCLYKLVPSTTRPGKTDKFPCNFRGEVVDAHTPANWLDADTAIHTARLYGDGYGTAFVFTENDPFFFLDIDDCLLPDGQTWSPTALGLLGLLPGAAVEISQSGTGLHVFGTGTCPDHGCKNTALNLEFYTEKRFVALTGNGAMGDAAQDCSRHLPGLVAQYFPPTASGKAVEWTAEPIEGWDGATDDDDLIARAKQTSSARSAFGDTCTFAQLWDADVDALAVAWPDLERGYDASHADAALAQHLAFWTGSNCERMLQIMRRSGLVREKWDREDYLVRTIKKAVSLQDEIFGYREPVDDTLAGTYQAPGLKGSAKQTEWAAQLRAQKLLDCQGEEELIVKLCIESGPGTEAKFWIDNQHLTPEEIAVALQPLESAASPLGPESGPEFAEGYQFLGVSQQVAHFKGCVYVQDLHRVFTPSGVMLKAEQFNATYGGYSFQLDSTGNGKTTRKAWEAFTESQAIRYPKAQTFCFRPDQPPGTLVRIDDRTAVNTYVPINTPRKDGDVSRFLDLLRKILPVPSDQEILLAYMAACIQYKGIKFQWAPLLQGVEGNGKTLFTRCVAFAIGKRYVHMPKASKIDSEFNAWLLGNIFIGVEDIYVPRHKMDVLETLKPMITGDDGIEIQFKGVDQDTRDICCNFMLNSNHKDGVPKTRNDRRLCVFFTAQQTVADLTRDGMAGNYFPKLYNWLKKEDGYAAVAQYLETYAIPDALNPATVLMRAPDTSSTDEAVEVSLGAAEQEILEAIAEGLPGFAGGWISSKALDRLLHAGNWSRAIPQNKRRGVLESLGYAWHPALKGGRANNHINLDGGKPRLFIKTGHISANLTTPADVARAYEAAQNATTGPSAAATAFS